VVKIKQPKFCVYMHLLIS